MKFQYGLDSKRTVRIRCICEQNAYITIKGQLQKKISDTEWEKETY